MIVGLGASNIKVYSGTNARGPVSSGTPAEQRKLSSSDPKRHERHFLSWPNTIVSCGTVPEDLLPPRALRKPAAAYPDILPHDTHFLTWPAKSVFVHQKHHWIASNDSRHEVRGELPLTAQMMIAPGTRPVFPTKLTMCY